MHLIASETGEGREAGVRVTDACDHLLALASCSRKLAFISGEANQEVSDECRNGTVPLARIDPSSMIQVAGTEIVIRFTFSKS